MPRKTDLFGPTFGGEQIIRIADVKKDPRYGKNSPYYGMPAGHLPVTSYLAAPVVSRSGEVLGGLFFGHPDEGVFTERHERIIEGLAAQAAIAMDNARLYEQSQRERAKAEAANRMKDEFLATVSHELRTPLNAIIGWSHMLRKSRLDEAMVARAVETIERNAKAQAQLIEDILDVSRVITGKLLLNIGPVDMASVINAAIDSVQLAADSKGIKLGMIIDPSARHVKGDSNRLQQVVWNLLSNAIRSAEGLWTREGETSHRQTLPSIEGVQVLLVDDDRDGLQVITAILSEYGAVLQTASSAAEALEILQWHRPDVLVSDLAMPDEDGYSLIRKIREQEAETSEIPAVALTALVRVEDRARVLAEGFNRFVPKPVELILAIAGLAEHSVLR